MLLRNLIYILQDENKTNLLLEGDSLTQALEKNSIQYIVIASVERFGISVFDFIPVYVSENYFIIEIDSSNETIKHRYLSLALKSIKKNIDLNSIPLESMDFISCSKTFMRTIIISLNDNSMLCKELQSKLDIYEKNINNTLDDFLRPARDAARLKTSSKSSSKFKSFIKKYIPWL